MQIDVDVVVVLSRYILLLSLLSVCVLYVPPATKAVPAAVPANESPLLLRLARASQRPTSLSGRLSFWQAASPFDSLHFRRDALGSTGGDAARKSNVDGSLVGPRSRGGYVRNFQVISRVCTRVCTWDNVTVMPVNVRNIS